MFTINFVSAVCISSASLRFSCARAVCYLWYFVNFRPLASLCACPDTTQKLSVEWDLVSATFLGLSLWRSVDTLSFFRPSISTGSTPRPVQVRGGYQEGRRVKERPWWRVNGGRSAIWLAILVYLPRGQIVCRLTNGWPV